MQDIFEEIAKMQGIPHWWVEAITIEYLECRLFAGKEDIWEFHFDKELGYEK